MWWPELPFADAVGFKEKAYEETRPSPSTLRALNNRGKSSEWRHRTDRTPEFGLVNESSCSELCADASMNQSKLCPRSSLDLHLLHAGSGHAHQIIKCKTIGQPCALFTSLFPLYHNTIHYSFCKLHIHEYNISVTRIKSNRARKNRY